jgi:hypothetical protein
MGILKNLLEKLRTKSSREKEAMEDVYLQKKVQERQKNANERELEKYYEEARQRAIENRLKQLRKKKTKEMWRSNMFTGNANLFKRKYY